MTIELLVVAAVALILAGVCIVQSLQLARLEKFRRDHLASPRPLQITEPTQAELESKLKAAYETKITEATGTFAGDLRATSTKLSEQVSRLTTKVIEEELDAYQKTLEQVRQAATTAMDQIHQAVESQRVEMRQGMEAELAAEKKLLADKFSAKMGDVVASYISESLGSGVDLGAQMQYILTSLEAHKSDIKKDLLGDV